MKFDKFKQHKITSIKCHQPPGGSSNFTLGLESDYHDNITRKNQNSSNIGVMNNMALIKELKLNVFKKEELELKTQKERCFSSEKLKISQAQTIPEKKSKVVDYRNVYKAGTGQKNLKTSVKVSNAPGGSSKISLGFMENK